ncbi:uncharacterized protein [Linepithema humile]|uniref:uncharacterized protein n=1 Tax=Linepithema humile TaxID=83485 RepID=UPI00351E7C52
MHRRLKIDENNFTKIREKDKSEKTVIPLSLQLSISNESEDIQEIEEIPKNNNQEKNLEESIHQEASKNIFKKRKRESDECNVTRGEQLRFLLNKSATGRCFLQLAKQGSYLKDKDRNKLTDIIIENQLSKCDKISPTEFTELVGAIQYLFPQEDSELYYIPYKYINGNKLLVKGKLITKYYSIRKEFKALGIIASKNKDQSDSQDDLVADDDLQGKLAFLKENVEPWPTIIDYWTDTSKQRIAQLHAKSRLTNKENDKRNINKSKTNRVILQTTTLIQEKKELENISTYLKKYPVLQEKLGYTLFEIDFDFLYPEQKLKAYNSYSEFCNRIIQALNNEDNKCETVKDNCLLFANDEISEDSKNLVALLSLCYLDTVVTVARKSGRTWRPP